MSMANRKGRKDSKNVNVSTTEDRHEIIALASKPKEQYEYLASKLNSDTENKNCEKYSQVSVKCVNNTVGGSNKITGKSFSRKTQRKTATRKERRKKSSKKKVSYQTTKGGKYIKNLSNRTLTDAQISLISRGLIIPVNKSINRNKIRRQMLRDFENFARQMRLKYMFHGKRGKFTLSTLNLTGTHQFNHQ